MNRAIASSTHDGARQALAKARVDRQEVGPVSPTVVDMILMIQNDSVTSGTLLSQSLALTVGKLFMVFSCRGKRDCR
jgi:hypothetical protein